MNFSEALNHLKKGDYICRLIWERENLHLNLIEDSRCYNNRWIGFYKDDLLICPWTANQYDLLSEDWKVL